MNLISISDLGKEDIVRLLDSADAFEAGEEITASH